MQKKDSAEILIEKLKYFDKHKIALLIELANYLEERNQAKAGGSIEFTTNQHGVTFLPKRTLFPCTIEIS